MKWVFESLLLRVEICFVVCIEKKSQRRFFDNNLDSCFVNDIFLHEEYITFRRKFENTSGA